MTDTRPTILWAALVTLFTAYTLVAWRAGSAPVWGPHKVRQADTMFAAYSMCERGTGPLLPRIANHEEREGVEIGELPVTAWAYALPCLAFGWSTRLARLSTLAIFALATWVWGRWFLARTGSEELSATWMLVFATASLHVTTLMTPLPDGVALVLVGLAGCLWRDHGLSGRRATVATVCFVMGILVRPYLFLLLLLVWPGWRRAAATVAATAVGYLLWYHLWIDQSETMYYAVDPRPLAAVWSELPLVLGRLGEPVLLGQLNGIGLVALFWAAWGDLRERSKWIWLATLVAVVVTQGLRFLAHPYYAIGASLAATVAVVLGLRDSPRGLRVGFVIVFALVGLARSSVLLDEPTADTQRSLRRLVAERSESSATFATYIDRDRYWLWVIERTGWVFSGDDWTGAEHCPADYALVWRAPGEAEVLACHR